MNIQETQYAVQQELAQHGFDFVGRVGGDVDAGAEAGIAGEHDGRDGILLVDVLEREQQLFHHRDVNDVERRVAEGDAGRWRVRGDGDAGKGGLWLACHAYL